MTWIRLALVVLLAGCTIKIEPLPAKKPVKRHRHTQKAKPHVTPTPTPTCTPTPCPKQPLQLEHMGAPTPIVNIPRSLSTIKLYQPPMV